MSLILCRYEPVKHPYFIERLGIHIMSSQELCYILYNHPLLAMDGFIDQALIQFIEEELDMPFLAGKLSAWKKGGEDPDEMIFIILQECYYYTSREVMKLRQKIGSYRKMNEAEFAKETADYYFRLKQYGAAIECYEKILDSWRIKSLSDEFTAKIWHNIGASYAGIFWFGKALAAYDMAYNFEKKPETLKKIYQLTLLDPQLKLKERYQAAITERQKRQWEQELQRVMEDAGKGDAVREIRELFNKDPLKRTAGAEKLVTEWKRAYRKML